ncbi:unnamed protein product [Mytilus coruscus]|uniref:Uncharacterized protein n=1 Tax=Mytilus coruscus TaxID=42192 RepID=A0A6J8DBN0_MYTCO|nr:unnamed protein product [Mytilus coruscus]
MRVEHFLYCVQISKSLIVIEYVISQPERIPLTTSRYCECVEIYIVIIRDLRVDNSNDNIPYTEREKNTYMHTKKYCLTCRGYFYAMKNLCLQMIQITREKVTLILILVVFALVKAESKTLALREQSHPEQYSINRIRNRASKCVQKEYVGICKYCMQPSSLT